MPLVDTMCWWTGLEGNWGTQSKIHRLAMLTCGDCIRPESVYLGGTPNDCRAIFPDAPNANPELQKRSFT